MASITVDTGVDATSEVGPHARIETINKVVELLAKRAVFTPGMFRVTANLTEVRELLSRCDDGQTACIAECDDNHLLGGLLLEALKDLPRSLLEFEAVVALEQPGNFADIGRSLRRYSPQRRQLLHSVTGLIRTFFVNSSANDSSLSHLVNVFAPVLCRPAAGAFMSIRHIKALPHLQTVLTTMVQYFDMVFKHHRVKSFTPEPDSDTVSQGNLHALGVVDELLSRVVDSWLQQPHGSDMWADVISPMKTGVSEVGFRPQGGASAGAGGGAAAGAGITTVKSVRASPPTDSDGSGGGSGDGSVEGAGADIANNAGRVHRGSRHAFRAIADEEGGDAAAAAAAAASSSTNGSTATQGLSMSPIRSEDGSAPAGGFTGNGSDAAAAAAGSRTLDRRGAPIHITTGPAAVSSPVSPPTPWIAEPGSAPASAGATAAAAAAAAAGDAVAATSAAAPTRASALVGSAGVDASATGAGGGAGAVTAGSTAGSGAGNGTGTGGGAPSSGSAGSASSSNGASAIAASSSSTTKSGRANAGGMFQRPLRPSGALRRQQVAEYRKLRVQVKKFEEKYMAAHGVLPKGKARAPLKEVYSRYRYLKQAVRDGSAVHIQSVYRGHLARAQTDVLRRAAEARASGGGAEAARRLRPASAPGARARARSGSGGGGAGDGAGGGAGVATRAAGGAGGGDGGAKDRRGDGGGSSSGGSGGRGSGSTASRPKSASASAASRDAGASGEVLELDAFDSRSLFDSVPALRAEKSSLKKQLKAFDTAFQKEHGKMPTNEDKEPIRHLYRRYHEVKEALAELEAEAAWNESTGGDSKSQSEFRALRREKRMLQLKLKTYEDEFQRLTGRKVRYHKDIRPVEAEYQRYKEVKALIQARTSAAAQ